jgi:hypothetical protein
MDKALFQVQDSLDRVLGLLDMIMVVAASEDYFLNVAIEVEAGEAIAVSGEIAGSRNQRNAEGTVVVEVEPTFDSDVENRSQYWTAQDG